MTARCYRQGEPEPSRETEAPGAGRRPGQGPVRLVAVDLDGVVWLGGVVLPGALEALSDVMRRGLELRYVTNNSTAHRETVSERLAAAGLPAGADRVFSSGYVTACWLQRRLPRGARVLVVGEAGLLRELAEAGLVPVRAGAEAPRAAQADQRSGIPGQCFDAVVVGMDRGFTFQALAQAQAAVRAGALFVGTNQDPTFPTPSGLLPGAGSLVAAVATAAEKEPVFMGKPGLALAEILAEATGVPAAQTLLLGDRLATDISMGRRAGMITALVLTGVTSASGLEHARAERGPDLPDHVLRTLDDLPPLLDTLTDPRGRGTSRRAE